MEPENPFPLVLVNPPFLQKTSSVFDFHPVITAIETRAVFDIPPPPGEALSIRDFPDHPEGLFMLEIRTQSKKLRRIGKQAGGTL
jgi:hypothetical protein